MDKEIKKKCTETNNQAEINYDEKIKSHCMWNKYDYFNFDEDADSLQETEPNLLIMEPCGRYLAGVSLGAGVFHVKRSHGSFYISAFDNAEIDPFPLLEEVAMDEGDVLLSSPMKTGAHWTYEIIKMLKSGTAEYTKLPKEAEWLDVGPYDKIVTWSPPGQRVINTHLPVSKLPPNFRRKDTKVVIVMRNLKDVIVSKYHHMLGIYSKYHPETDPKEFWATTFKQMLYSHKLSCGNHLDVYREYWCESRLDPNVLIVFYENLKRHCKNEIRRIADHLGIACPNPLIEEIVNAVEISKMKQGKIVADKFYEDQCDNSLYRKGEIGDWKSTFTVAENEEFDRVFNEWNKDLQIPFIWE